MTKERLKNYRRLWAEAEQLRHNIADMGARITAPTSARPDRQSIRTSGGQRPSELLIDAWDSLCKKYRRKLEKICAEMQAIEAAISDLHDPIDRCIFRLRYLQGLTWEQVCEHPSVCYSWSQVQRRHKAALKELQEGEDRPA